MSKKNRRANARSETLHTNEAPSTSFTSEPVAESNVGSQVADPGAAGTAESVMVMTKAQILEMYGTKSNAIRAMAALGIKAGPISKKLEIRYQHARNVLSRPLKRVIKEERDRARTESPAVNQETTDVVTA